MPPMYPLQFQPQFRRYLWGGRRLGTVLGKAIGCEEDYAESWEIVDHGADQSIVRNGPWAGAPLKTLVAECGRELFGVHAPQNQFPLLLKFLDCHRNLSVQVHPNDDQAAQNKPPDRGKTEAWVILHAESDSWIYAGLKYPMDRAELATRIAAGETAACLHRFQPQVGDCVFIPAGTVHALGAGLIVAEIQQTSDTTYRLYDWDRLGPNGQPRPLHPEQALAVIDYQAGPVQPQRPEKATANNAADVERLVTCEHFVLERRQLHQPTPLGDDGRFHLLVVLNGALKSNAPQTPPRIAAGEVVLLPAHADAVEWQPQGKTTLLDIYLP